MEAYPEYKSSGVKWLGDIPSVWTVSKSKYLLGFNMGQSPDSTSVNQEGNGLPFIQGNAEFGLLHPSEKNYCTEPTKICSEGDLLISVRAPVGAMNIADKPFVIGRGLSALSATKKIDFDFLWFAMQSYKEQLVVMETGTTFKAVSGDDLRNIIFALPPLIEQIKIAKGLKRETSRIDNLIAEKEKFIELLKEKRQALISYVVTKGLDDSVPVKESGVEWIGEIPEHWDVKRLKHISPKIGVGLVINPSTYTKDEGLHYIFGGDVKEFRIDLSSTRKISKEDSDALVASRLNSGDLVSIRVGYPGVTAVVTDELQGANCASVIIIRKGDFNSDWLCSCMNSKTGKDQVDLAVYGAAMKQYNVSDAVEFSFPFPPSKEQDEIADHIFSLRQKIQILVDEVGDSIELLKEHRSALISAAVTGKIDVREGI